MISYEKAIEVLRALQRDAYNIDLLKDEMGPDFHEAVEISYKEIVDTLLKLDLIGELEQTNSPRSVTFNSEQDMFSYDEMMCPFGREFTVADLPRLKKTDALALGRSLTKEELIQNRLITALTEYQSPSFERSNIDIVIEYQYGSGFMSSTYRSPSKDNVAVIFVPKKQGKAFLKKGPGWSRFDQFARKSPLDSQIKTASARVTEKRPTENRSPERAMTAIRQGYDEFSLFPNEDLEGITLVHGGGQVKVNGVLYELQRPLSMQDCVKLDAITDRPKRHKVDDYFPRRDPYDPYR